MAVASREVSTTHATLTTYVERSTEVLWLLTAALVPLIFVPTDFMRSEAVNAYVEVPKTAGLRTLVGMMTILCIVEWALKGGLTRAILDRSLLDQTQGLGSWAAHSMGRGCCHSICGSGHPVHISLGQLLDKPCGERCRPSSDTPPILRSHTSSYLQLWQPTSRPVASSGVCLGSLW